MSETYWRTQTIAKAQEQGYSHLRAVCSGCAGSRTSPFPLLLHRRGVSRDTFIGNIGFRCQKCGSTSPLVGMKQNAR
jgi:hypothetical protein